MSATILPRRISCDESGFSGNDMLGSGQPYFSYASHDLDAREAADLVRSARQVHPVQMPELKAALLTKTTTGRKLLAYIIERMKGRYIASVYDKKLSLCYKFFEYIFEPVLQSNNMIFYQNNFHRFFGMFLYMQMLAKGASIDVLAGEFEAFMRTLDPMKCPTLLGGAASSGNDPLIGQILRFTKGYNAIIVNETRHLRSAAGAGKWVLDLTISAVFNHLVAWGERHHLLEVVCDDSKPLRALAGTLDVMIARGDDAYMQMGGQKHKLTWTMSKPIGFASSRIDDGVQLADLVAGVAALAPRGQEGDGLSDLFEQVHSHYDQYCILPDLGMLDLKKEDTMVNWFILEELAKRADRGDDPVFGIGRMYELARETLPAHRDQFLK